MVRKCKFVKIRRKILASGYYRTFSRSAKVRIPNWQLQLIPVGGRLLRWFTLFPVVVFPKHLLTNAILLNEYHHNMHASAQPMLASIKLRYWSMKSREIIQGVLRKYVTCFRVKLIDVSYKMGRLARLLVTYNKPGEGVHLCTYLVFSSGGSFADHHWSFDRIFFKWTQAFCHFRTQLEVKNFHIILLKNPLSGTLGEYSNIGTLVV